MRIFTAGEEWRERWEEYVSKTYSGSFLHSWQWGEFQKKAGFRIGRLLAIDESSAGAIKAVALLVERPLVFKQVYFYCPWGPVMNYRQSTTEEISTGLNLVKEGAEKIFKKTPVYFRVEPRVSRSGAIEKGLQAAGFKMTANGVQPRDTLIVDLRKEEDDLLREMHSKTRYNIRLAIRQGVEVEEKTSQEGLDIFLKLAQEVENQEKFHYHAPAYYRAMLETLGKSGILKILTAFHKGSPLAAGLFVKYAGMATYTHGASSRKRSHIMAPHLLHWEAMRVYCREGATHYDFFGIAPNNSSSHPWYGISRFKKGFGGEEVHYAGSAEAVIDPVSYRLMNAAKGVRNFLHS